MKTAFLAISNCLVTPFSKPLPAPSKITNIKIPQATLSIVIKVRSLFLRIVVKISCHLSISNIFQILSGECLVGSERLNRFYVGSSEGRKQPRQSPGNHQYHGSGYGHAHVHFGLAKKAHFAAPGLYLVYGSAEQVEQCHAKK